MQKKRYWKLHLALMDTMSSSGYCLNSEIIMGDDHEWYIQAMNYLIHKMKPGLESLIRSCIADRKRYRLLYKTNGENYIILLRLKSHDAHKVMTYFFKESS